jgi:hypothetical protein
MLRVSVIEIVMDVIYQFIVFRWLYPVEAIDTAFILAFVPYPLIRGPVNRIARQWKHGASTSPNNL